MKRADDQGRGSHGLSTEDADTAKARLAQKRGSAFDPYQGAFANQPPRRKKDLRKVGQWLEAKRRAEGLKNEGAGED